MSDFEIFIINILKVIRFVVCGTALFLFTICVLVEVAAVVQFMTN